MSHETMRNDCALYALGLLEGDALRELEDRMERGDAAVLAELGALERAAMLVGISAGPLPPPPPALKRRVLSAVGDHQGFYYATRADQTWSSGGTEGQSVSQLFVDPRDLTTTALVRLAPGTRHRELGRQVGHELFVIAGDLVLGDQQLSRGDYHRRGGGSHEGETHEGCTLLAILPPAASRGDSATLRSGEGDWTDAGGGTLMKLLGEDRGRGTQLYLVRMEAGAVFPEHDHAGAEELFMLRGDCTCQGQRLGAGDYHRASQGSHHQPTTTEDGCEMVVVMHAAA